MKKLILIFIAIGVFPWYLNSQTGTVDSMLEYNCLVLDRTIGPNPRITIDEEKKMITYESAGLKFVDKIHFDDSLMINTDTLSNIIPNNEKFTNGIGKDLQWKRIDSPISQTEIDSFKYLLTHPNEKLVSKADIYLNEDKLKDLLLIGYGDLPTFMDETKKAFYLLLFLNRGNKFSIVENYGINIWTNLIGYYVTDFRYNNFPVILVLKEGEKPELTKRMMIILNRGHPEE